MNKMIIMSKNVVTVLALCVFGVSCQDGAELCSTQSSCSDCMEASVQCSWCLDMNFTTSIPRSRCNTEGELKAARCADIHSRKPFHQMTVIQNQELNDVGDDTLQEAVQIKPQRVKMHLRPHETQSLRMTYRPAKNFPLDLYYLMDLSWSMKDDKETLVNLGDQLPAQLKDLTSHFRLGFGSFADKMVMPFAMLEPRHLENPCESEKDFCEPLYEYKHRLKLTRDTKEFFRQVNNSYVTANRDNREGGLDALVQAIVCKERVGWSNARRILIYASDGILHFAGDGKLGGVVDRNDVKCHLSSSGEYTHANKLDYPSLEQVNKLLKQYKVYVIFAVTKTVIDEYSYLHKELPENTYLGILEEDSSNILQLVRQGYTDTVSAATFTDNSTGFVKVEYFSNCGAKRGLLSQTNKCENINIGQEYEFKLNFTLEKCPTDSSLWKQTVAIEEQQLASLGLTVELELSCGCPCESWHLRQPHHQWCKGHGDLSCGQCICNQDWSGPKCECNTANSTSIRELEERCMSKHGGQTTADDDDPVWEEIKNKWDNSGRSVGMRSGFSSGLATAVDREYTLCSGYGDCQCGSCYCDQGRDGQYCECPICPRSDLGVCGGPSQGICDCGICTCLSGWTGEICDCPTGEESCVAPGDKVICSGRGKCSCGLCKCTNDEYGSKFTGRYCETCPTCDNRVCKQFQACVKCHIEANCTIECIGERNALYTPIDVVLLSDNELNHMCLYRADFNNKTCDYQYSYASSNSSNFIIKILPQKCQPPSLMATLPYYLFFATLLIGIIGIVAYKLVQIRKDNIAYKKFEEEANNMIKMSEMSQTQNPLYRSPLTTFVVPKEFHRTSDKVDSGQFVSSENSGSDTDNDELNKDLEYVYKSSTLNRISQNSKQS